MADRQSDSSSDEQHDSSSDEQSDSSSDEEENRHIVIRGLRAPRRIRKRVDYFTDLNKREFFDRFRLSKTRVQKVLKLIKREIKGRNAGTYSISPMTLLLLAIRFYATGCFSISAGDFFGVTRWTASKIIKRVSIAIARLSSRFIKTPSTPAEIQQTQREFFHVSGFIRVVGCIDCKHVKVQSYGGPDAELSRNRKGFTSINVQAVVNSRLEFMDLVVRWHGAAHDSMIFNHSNIKQKFENGRFGYGLMLGDSGYPNEKYLMTPLANPATAADHLYNEAFIRSRCCVERTFGIWARRFPVLSMGSRFKSPAVTMPVIIATAVLHNIARGAAATPRIDRTIYDGIPQTRDQMAPNIDTRDHIIHTYFDRLL